MEKHHISERRACRAIGQPRNTQRHKIKRLSDEDVLTHKIIELANQYGCYGPKMITGLLKGLGMHVNHKRVERIWREQSLKVLKKQKKKSRLWTNDGSCIRLRQEYPKHVWSYDIVEDKTYDGRKFRILNILDGHERECMACYVSRKISSIQVIECLSETFLRYGMPEYLRSDNGSEFIAKRVREFLSRLGTQPTYITPGSLWENGYVESFNGKMRNELLNGEIFDNIFEARILIERWRKEYNTVRPHSSLGYKPPAPVAMHVNKDKCCKNALSGL